MDPVSAIGLASACASLVTKIASASKGVSDFVTHVNDADKSIGFLASHLGLIELVVDELQKWLDRNPSLEPRSRLQVALAIRSCDIIVTDIAEFAAKVTPHAQEKTSTFRQKMALLWNDAIIKEHRESLSHSLLAFHILISLTQLWVSSFPPGVPAVTICH